MMKVAPVVSNVVNVMVVGKQVDVNNLCLRLRHTLFNAMHIRVRIFIGAVIIVMKLPTAARKLIGLVILR